MPTVKNVGEPCAGEPHARFDAAAGGNQASRHNAARPRRLPPTLLMEVRTAVPAEVASQWMSSISGAGAGAEAEVELC